MTGLEEIEQFMAAGTRPPMMDLFDIDLLEAEEGKVVFVATPTSQTYNFMGIAMVAMPRRCWIRPAASRRTPRPKCPSTASRSNSRSPIMRP